MDSREKLGMSWRMSRRSLLKVMGVGALGAVLGACQPEAPAATAAPKAEASEVPQPEGPKEAPRETVVINIDHRGYQPDAEGKGGEELVRLRAEWEEMHPGYKIDWYTMDFQGMEEHAWIERRLVAKDGPDLLFGNMTYRIETWMQGGLMNFYDPYLDLPNPYVDGNTRWYDQFIKKSETQSNGKTAWIGLDNTTLSYFYNVDMFEDMGVAPPGGWEEMIELFKVFEENDIVPCAMKHSKAYAIWTFDPVANQILHEVYDEMVGGEGREPLPEEVAQYVKDGKLTIGMPQYQDTLRLASEWWQYAQKGAYSGGDDDSYSLFLSQKAATRYGGCWENGNLLTDMPEADDPFAWNIFSIPVIPKTLSDYATGHATAAVFIAGYLLYMIPSYNSGEKLDATIDWLMYLSKPSNLEAVMNQTKNLVPNIRGVNVDGMEGFYVPEDATYWHINSWGSPMITQEGLDAWVRNWQLLLLGEMSLDEYNDTMQTAWEDVADKYLASL
jgi:hypothetical protein